MWATLLYTVTFTNWPSSILFLPAARHGNATIGVCTEDDSVRYSSRALGVLQGYFGRRVSCFHCQEVTEEPLIMGILQMLPSVAFEIIRAELQSIADSLCLVKSHSSPISENQNVHHFPGFLVTESLKTGSRPQAKPKSMKPLDITSHVTRCGKWDHATSLFSISVVGWSCRSLAECLAKQRFKIRQVLGI